MIVFNRQMMTFVLFSDYERPCTFLSPAVRKLIEAKHTGI